MSKERLDKLLVQRTFVDSRERAKALIMAGQVVVDDHTIDKSGTRVEVTAEIRIKGEPLPYVSRGGLKLAEALKQFDIDVTDVVAIDVGASTGGFTDCLLQHGAATVFAVDVGYGQLAWSLREDERVVNIERTNIRDLTSDALSVTPALAVIDASFISLEKVLPSTLALLSEDARIIALIKPQFEVGKGRVGKGGVVRDPELHEEVIERVSRFATEAGCRVDGLIESPLLGPKGNKEFLILLTRTGR